MSQTIQERNKALVLEAFNTLFNKRDYEAAERFWSPNYIQHSAHIAPGRAGLFNMIKSIPPTLKYHRTDRGWCPRRALGWCHLHPHVFMENLLTTQRIVDDKFIWLI